jgi:hypothetical protein
VRTGSHPSIRVQQRYEWISLCGFVHPHSGRTEWLILPTVDSETMNLALAQFARAVGANAQKHIARLCCKKAEEKEVACEWSSQMF